MPTGRGIEQLGSTYGLKQTIENPICYRNFLPKPLGAGNQLLLADSSVPFHDGDFSDCLYWWLLFLVAVVAIGSAPADDLTLSITAAAVLGGAYGLALGLQSVFSTLSRSCMASPVSRASPLPQQPRPMGSPAMVSQRRLGDGVGRHSAQWSQST
jgi:hypothetical protein